jgi:NADP-dependent 3-hydroxy acid dehydrogenase YdfG
MTSVTIDMSGKVALVTGGGYGMGRASARRFASCGAQVMVADIDEAHGEETVGLIAKEGGEAIFVKADVSQSADVQDMVARPPWIWAWRHGPLARNAHRCMVRSSGKIRILYMVTR